MTVQATQFAEHNGTSYVPGGRRLPAGSLRMTAPTVTPRGVLATPPAVHPGAPWQIDVATAVKIASESAVTSAGVYDFSSTSLALTIPPSAYAATYRSDVTLSVTSGP